MSYYNSATESSRHLQQQTDHFFEALYQHNSGQTIPNLRPNSGRGITSAIKDYATRLPQRDLQQKYALEQHDEDKAQEPSISLWELLLYGSSYSEFIVSIHINRPDEYGNTPLHQALLLFSLTSSTAEQSSPHTPSLNSPNNDLDQHGHQPQEPPMEPGLFVTVNDIQFLLEHNADINLPNKQNMSPLALAFALGLSEVIFMMVHLSAFPPRLFQSCLTTDIYTPMDIPSFDIEMLSHLMVSYENSTILNDNSPDLLTRLYAMPIAIQCDVFSHLFEHHSPFLHHDNPSFSSSSLFFNLFLQFSFPTTQMKASCLLQIIHHDIEQWQRQVMIAFCKEIKTIFSTKSTCSPIQSAIMAFLKRIIYLRDLEHDAPGTISKHLLTPLLQSRYFTSSQCLFPVSNDTTPAAASSAPVFTIISQYVSSMISQAYTSLSPYIFSATAALFSTQSPPQSEPCSESPPKPPSTPSSHSSHPVTSSSPSSSINPVPQSSPYDIFEQQADFAPLLVDNNSQPISNILQSPVSSAPPIMNTIWVDESTHIIHSSLDSGSTVVGSSLHLSPTGRSVTQFLSQINIHPQSTIGFMDPFALPKNPTTNNDKKSSFSMLVTMCDICIYDIIDRYDNTVTSLQGDTLESIPLFDLDKHADLFEASGSGDAQSSILAAPLSVNSQIKPRRKPLLTSLLTIVEDDAIFDPLDTYQIRSLQDNGNDNDDPRGSDDDSDDTIDDSLDNIDNTQQLIVPTTTIATTTTTTPATTTTTTAATTTTPATTTTVTTTTANSKLTYSALAQDSFYYQQVGSIDAMLYNIQSNGYDSPQEQDLFQQYHGIFHALPSANQSLSLQPSQIEKQPIAAFLHHPSFLYNVLTHQPSFEIFCLFLSAASVCESPTTLMIHRRNALHQAMSDNTSSLSSTVLPHDYSIFSDLTLPCLGIENHTWQPRWLHILVILLIHKMNQINFLSYAITLRHSIEKYGSDRAQFVDPQSMHESNPIHSSLYISQSLSRTDQSYQSLLSQLHLTLQQAVSLLHCLSFSSALMTPPRFISVPYDTTNDHFMAMVQLLVSFYSHSFSTSQCNGQSHLYLLFISLYIIIHSYQAQNPHESTAVMPNMYHAIFTTPLRLDETVCGYSLSHLISYAFPHHNTLKLFKTEFQATLSSSSSSSSSLSSPPFQDDSDVFSSISSLLHTYCSFHTQLGLLLSQIAPKPSSPPLLRHNVFPILSTITPHLAIPSITTIFSPNDVIIPSTSQSHSQSTMPWYLSLPTPFSYPNNSLSSSFSILRALSTLPLPTALRSLSKPSVVCYHPLLFPSTSCPHLPSAISLSPFKTTSDYVSPCISSFISLCTTITTNNNNNNNLSFHYDWTPFLLSFTDSQPSAAGQAPSSIPAHQLLFHAAILHFQEVLSTTTSFIDYLEQQLTTDTPAAQPDTVGSPSSLPVLRTFPHFPLPTTASDAWILVRLAIWYKVHPTLLETLCKLACQLSFNAPSGTLPPSPSPTTIDDWYTTLYREIEYTFSFLIQIPYQHLHASLFSFMYTSSTLHVLDHIDTTFQCLISSWQSTLAVPTTSSAPQPLSSFPTLSTFLSNQHIASSCWFLHVITAMFQVSSTFQFILGHAQQSLDHFVAAKLSPQQDTNPTESTLPFNFLSPSNRAIDRFRRHQRSGQEAWTNESSNCIICHDPAQKNAFISFSIELNSIGTYIRSITMKCKVVPISFNESSKSSYNSILDAIIAMNPHPGLLYVFMTLFTPDQRSLITESQHSVSNYFQSSDSSSQSSQPISLMTLNHIEFSSWANQTKDQLVGCLKAWQAIQKLRSAEISPNITSESDTSSFDVDSFALSVEMIREIAFWQHKQCLYLSPVLLHPDMLLQGKMDSL